MSARDGIAILVTIGKDRLKLFALVATVLVREALEPFVNIPTVVPALFNRGHFLDPVLPYVGQPEIACLLVEAKTPEIPQPIGPVFRTEILPTHEGIVLRDGILPPRVLVINIDAYHLPQKESGVLGMPVRVVVRAGIAHREVEEALRPEVQTPPL